MANSETDRQNAEPSSQEKLIEDTLKWNEEFRKRREEIKKQIIEYEAADEQRDTRKRPSQDEIAAHVKRWREM